MENKTLTKRLSLILVAVLALAGASLVRAGSAENISDQGPSADVARGIGEFSLQTLTDAKQAGIDFQNNDVLRSMDNIGLILPATLEKNPSMIRFVDAALRNDKGVNVGKLKDLNKLPLERRMEIIKAAGVLAQHMREAQGRIMPKGKSYEQLEAEAASQPGKIVDWSQVKFGLRPSLHPTPKIRWSKYAQLLPAPPETVDMTGGITNWGMLGNDKFGDCVEAGALHWLMARLAMVGIQRVFTTQDALSLYKAIVPTFNPNKPSTDSGTDPEDMFKYWENPGIFGDILSLMVPLDLKNAVELKESTWALGGTGLAVALPKSIQNQTVWDVPKGGPKGRGRPGSLGGHFIPVLGVGPEGISFISWARKMLMTPAFFNIYPNAVYASVDPAFLNKNGKTPNLGLDLQGMIAEAKAIPSQSEGRGKHPKK